MRRITLWLLSTLAGLVLLFNYRTSTTSSAASSSAVATATTSSSASAELSTQTSDTGSYDGSVEQTRWGPVQVRITVAGGRITDVTVLAYPDGNRHDQQINARALPILREQVIEAQSADIDIVSGATDTSEGYLESLQAAIDAAHL